MTLPEPSTADVPAAPPRSPFARLRARVLLPAAMLGGGVAAFGTSQLYRHASQPRVPDERVVAFVAYLGTMGAVLLVARAAGVHWRRLFGHVPERSELALAVVVIPTGLLTYAAALASYIALSWIAPGFVQRTLLAPDTLADVHSLGAWLLLFLVGVVAAPLLEEMLFRGLLMQRWAHRWGTTTGVVASSALFAVLHQEWIGHFLVGVTLSVLYLRTRSLWTPIAAHALNNGIAILGTLPGAISHHVEPPETIAGLRGHAWAIAPLLAAGLVTLWFYLRRYFPGGVGAVLRGRVPYGDSGSGLGIRD